MEFTSPVSEQDFVHAYWLNCKSGFRTVLTNLVYLGTAISWILVLAAFAYAQLRKGTFAGSVAVAAAETLLPSAILLALWLVAFRVLVPIILRRRYRASGLAGVDVVHRLSEEGLHVTPSQWAPELTPWSGYRYWSESSQVFIVGINTSKYCLLPKGALTVAQQDELRAVLIPVLRKK